MSQNSVNNKRIARNTALLYVRMLLLMVVTLYTSRIVLRELGVVDFGIFNVVAGFVSVLGFFTSSLSNAAQRYLSIGLGCGDRNATTEAFRQSHTLMLLFSAFVVLCGETVGLWFVCNGLVIPDGRMDAAFWVYQSALVATVCSVLQVTFMAAIVAHERMGVYAWLGLFEAFARLGIAYVLCVTSEDRLVIYGILTALVSVITLLSYVFYCRIHFAESDCRLYWNKTLVGGMSKFIGYNLFGCFSYSAGVQGVNVILNLFFGPAVNAARGIAVQVSSVVTRFSENIMTAVKPQIIKSYASGDREYMIMLVERSSKYAFILSALLAIPVMFEARYLLELWLGEVPDHTVSFTRLVLCEQLIAVLVPPLWIAANATGDIKRNQVYGRLFTLCALPVSYVLLSCFREPSLPMFVLVVMQLLYWLYCLYDIRKQLDLDIIRYARTVVVPNLVLTFVLLSAGFILVRFIPEDSLWRCIKMSGLLLSIGLVTVLCIMDQKERSLLKSVIMDKLKLG